MRNIRWIILFACLTLFAPCMRAQTTAGDNSETLEWVLKTANLLEKRLNDAVADADVAGLLIKLMESYEDFEAVALIGLYCHEARTAAELGRNHCNWLTTYSRDKDLNSLILRAQDGRVQAARMSTAAAACLKTATQSSKERGFTLADVLYSNSDAIQHDLTDGLAAQDFHILSQKVEHAERTFHDTEVLAMRLNNCETVRSTARQGIVACMEVLNSQNWTLVNSNVQKALACAAKIKERAGECRL